MTGKTSGIKAGSFYFTGLFCKIKRFCGDCTAAYRNYIAEAAFHRRRVLLAGFFFMQIDAILCQKGTDLTGFGYSQKPGLDI